MARFTPAQQRALDVWEERTRPGKNYLIDEVFSERTSAGNGMRRAFRKLVDRGVIRKGIPGGNPLKPDFVDVWLKFFAKHGGL